MAGSRTTTLSDRRPISFGTAADPWAASADWACAADVGIGVGENADQRRHDRVGIGVDSAERVGRLAAHGLGLVAQRFDQRGRRRLRLGAVEGEGPRRIEADVGVVLLKRGGERLDRGLADLAEAPGRSGGGRPRSLPRRARSAPARRPQPWDREPRVFRRPGPCRRRLSSGRRSARRRRPRQPGEGSPAKRSERVRGKCASWRRYLRPRDGIAYSFDESIPVWIGGKRKWIGEPRNLGARMRSGLKGRLCQRRAQPWNSSWHGRPSPLPPSAIDGPLRAGRRRGERG